MTECMKNGGSPLDDVPVYHSKKDKDIEKQQRTDIKTNQADQTTDQTGQNEKNGL